VLTPSQFTSVSYRKLRVVEMDSKKSSKSLYILLPASIAAILLYRPVTKRLLYGDTDQSTAKAQEASGPKLIRISGVPQDWTDEDVLNGLLAVGPTCIFQGQVSKLTLYPDCSGTRQTGLLSLDKYTGLIECNKPGGITLEIAKEDNTETIDLDSHFHDLTPLNTPENDILAE
jgi:hypothetical protein